jgi:hypothetical protein
MTDGAWGKYELLSTKYGEGWRFVVDRGAQALCLLGAIAVKYYSNKVLIERALHYLTAETLVHPCPGRLCYRYRCHRGSYSRCR